MRAKQYKFTAKDISEATGVSVDRVWKDIREGELDPSDLYGLYSYMGRHGVVIDFRNGCVNDFSE